MQQKGRGLRGGPSSRWTGGCRRLPKRLGVVSCQLQVPLRLALGVRGTAARHRLGAWAVPPPSLQ